MENISYLFETTITLETAKATRRCRNTCTIVSQEQHLGLWSDKQRTNYCLKCAPAILDKAQEAIHKAQQKLREL